MKKVIFSALALGMLFVACQKDEVMQINNNPIVNSNKSSLIDGFDGVSINSQFSVIDFESIGKYEEIVDNEDFSQLNIFVDAINKTDFSSYGKHYPKSELYDDEFMEAILNTESIVKIGNWFVKIDMKRELVFLCENTNNNSYSNLVNNVGSSIYSLSIEEDVLDYMRDKTLFDSKGKLFCDEKRAPRGTKTKKWTEYCDGYEYKFKEIYWPYGIFHRLKLKFYPNQLGGSDDITDFAVEYKYVYKKRCRSGGAGEHQFAANPGYEYTDEYLELTFYSGTRSLTKYYIGNFISSPGSTAGASVRFRNKCTDEMESFTLPELKHGY